MVLSWWTSTPPIQQSDTIHERGSPVTHSKVRDHLPVVLVSNWHQKSGVKTKEKKLYSPAHPWRHLRALAAKKHLMCLGHVLSLTHQIEVRTKKGPMVQLQCFLHNCFANENSYVRSCCKKKVLQPWQYRMRRGVQYRTGGWWTVRVDVEERFVNWIEL
jgi:hypothetical protein